MFDDTENDQKSEASGRAASAVERLVMFVRRMFCRHVFRGPDLIPRDSAGMVTWPCSKCGKVFRAEYGLKMRDHGVITGPWGTRT